MGHPNLYFMQAQLEKQKNGYLYCSKQRMSVCLCCSEINASYCNSYHHLLSRMAELRGRLLQITGEVIWHFLLHTHTHTHTPIVNSTLCRILCQPPIHYTIHQLRVLFCLVRGKEMTSTCGDGSHNFL